MSAKQTIYQAAKQIDNPFTLERLLVSAWHRDQETFGLDGFKDAYPDSRKLANSIYGSSGMIAQGSIVKDGDKYRAGTPPVADRYRRKEKGHLNGRPPAEPAPLDPRLVRALQSRAYRLFGEGKRDAVDMRDALSFWGSNLAEKVAEFGDLLRSQETPEMRVLLNVHAHLIGRFGRHLKQKVEA